MVSSEMIQVLHPLLHTHIYNVLHMICGELKGNLWIP